METVIRALLRAAPALISFAFFILFLLPVSVGIINLGNCAGALATGALTAVFLFFGRFREFILRVWEHTPGKIFLCAAALLLTAGIVLASVVSFFMVRAMNNRPLSTDTTVVVLGCKVKNGGPSLMLKRRLDAAYDYLAENESVCVVVSGGQGSDESISESQCMRDYLAGRGIAPGRIYMEDKSANTEENLRFSQQVILREGLSKNITIVTDGFHQLRADMLAEKIGMSATSISAKTPGWLLPTYWVREWFGVVYYRLFG